MIVFLPSLFFAIGIVSGLLTARRQPAVRFAAWFVMLVLSFVACISWPVGGDGWAKHLADTLAYTGLLPIMAGYLSGGLLTWVSFRARARASEAT